MAAAALARAPALAAGGTQPGGLAGGAPMASAEGCKSCHGGLTGDDGQPYLAWDTWAGSMMANAARDPLFRAAVAVAEQDRAGSGTFCLRCHTPSAFVESRIPPADGSRLSAVDDEGVHCAVCHRAVDGSQPPISDPMAPLIGNAQLYFDLGQPTQARYRGPYADPAPTPAHEAAGDPFVSDDSRLCGQCHQLTNPDEHQVDLAGNDTGRPFPLDTTFEEWQQSEFAPGHGCASCHMPVQQGMWPVATGADDRPSPPRHDFAGGNEWGPALMKAAFPGLRDEAYDRARAAAQAMLKQAASLEVRAAPAGGIHGHADTITVRVTNLSGHKLPTGYADGRRAWLEVAVVDAAGVAEVQSGAFDAATGELAEDRQLRLYEAVHGRDGAAEDHIVLHRQVLRDTRIPPRGFRPTAATQPVGPITFTDGSGTVQPYDEPTFKLQLPAAGAQATVRVRLMYQAMTAHHVEALAGALPAGDAATRLRALWQASGRAAPVVMAEVTETVPLRAPPPEGCRCEAGPAGRGQPGTAALPLLAALALALAARRRPGDASASRRRPDQPRLRR